MESSRLTCCSLCFSKRKVNLFLFQKVLRSVGFEKDFDRFSPSQLVKKYSDNIAPMDPFRPYIDTIIKKVFVPLRSSDRNFSQCPIQYHDLVSGEGSFELSYDK